MTEYAAKVGLWKLGAISDDAKDAFVAEMQRMQTEIIAEGKRLIALRCKTVRSIDGYFQKF